MALWWQGGASGRHTEASMLDQHERRRHGRVPIDLQLIAGDYWSSPRAHVVDLSVWGLRYYTALDAAPPRQREVYLEFMLPDDGEPVCALGLVTAEQRDQLFCSRSVRFTQLSHRDQQRLRDFVRRRFRIAA
ncbi:MAG: PilZ domain-containing protein [Deltaproteobacteria bacterium]|nr:PilZ domain-containing protein [Deltaproteobacteria bacterium]